MGYRPPTTGQKLDFAGTEHEGLEVTVDAAPMGAALGITELFGTARQRNSQEAAGALREVLATFASVLEAWNVEHPRTGEPVPPTVEGLLSLDTDFVMFVIGAWLTGTTGADEELGKDSTSGGTSEEALIPMDVLSESPQSLSPQRL